MNKNLLVTILVVVEFSWCTYARPKPIELPSEIGAPGPSIDFETLKSYADGTYKDKYNGYLTHNFEGYEANQKHTFDDFNSNSGGHYERESSVGSDALGHKSKSKAVFGAGYEHENQVVYGTELEHKGELQVGESKLQYGGEASSSASYDKTGLGGSIGPRAKGSVKGTAFGIGLGASAEVGVAADVGYNSHEQNVALKAVTPVGAYGAKIGCLTEICFIGCVSVSLC